MYLLLQRGSERSQNVVELYREVFRRMMVGLKGACTYFRQIEPRQRKLTEK